jgi:hypothetical protein
MSPAPDTASRAARQLMKQALRSYGAATSPLRAGPDFVVIGAKRGGTTSLYNYLLEHRSVQPLFPGRQQVKGPHFFDSEYGRGPRWYRSHFPLAVGGRHLARPAVTPAISGEASPYYLFHPLAAQRLASAYPDVRLIVMLRDPAERAYSHYKERVRHGAEELSFTDALDAEAGRLAGEEARIRSEPGYRSAEHEDHSYLAQGRYLDMLPRWFELFGREQFYIGISEEFYADPGRVVNEVWSFLGLAPATLRSTRQYNYHPAADIAAPTRQRLRETFADHNQQLAGLLGRSLPWPAGLDQHQQTASVPQGGHS